MFHFLLPAAFFSWLETEVRARAVRMFGLADRQLDLAERELAARESFAGITVAVNRIEAVPETNGRRKQHVK